MESISTKPAIDECSNKTKFMVFFKEQKNHQNTPEMRAKYKECADAESQLVEIEQRLGIVVYTKLRNKRNIIIKLRNQ